MTIESNIVAAGPTVPRGKTPVHAKVVKSTSGLSPGVVQPTWDPQLGDWVTKTVEVFPVHGQLIAVMNPYSNEVAMYVGYSTTPSVSNTSVWKPVKLVSLFVNPDTGKAWDPLQNF